ncbi:unnamed protein product [Somion occarium]
MLSVFKKPVDLEEIYKTWVDPPFYRGKPRRDGPVDQWLLLVKTECKAKKIPKSMWHLVAEHFLQARAKKRFDAVKTVMDNMYQGAYTWNWKRFKIAMRNMQWELDSGAVQTFFVRTLETGVSWIFGPSKGKEEEIVVIEKCDQPFLMRALRSVTNSSMVSSIKDAAKDSKAATKDAKSATKDVKSTTKDAKSSPKDSKTVSKDSKVVPKNSKSLSKDWQLVPKETKKESKKSSTDVLAAAKPSTIIWKVPQVNKDISRLLLQKQGEKDLILSHSQVPIWLLEACNYLDTMTSEHKGTMSIIAAVLITVGSVPALPAVQAGAAGALLASSTAQVIGSTLAGVGAWLGMQAEAREASSASRK